MHQYWSRSMVAYRGRPCRRQERVQKCSHQMCCTPGGPQLHARSRVPELSSRVSSRAADELHADHPV
jgi:hypothetical protein